jgi:hypothetical protein
VQQPGHEARQSAVGTGEQDTRKSTATAHDQALRFIDRRF